MIQFFLHNLVSFSILIFDVKPIRHYIQLNYKDLIYHSIRPVHNVIFMGYNCKVDDIANDINVYCKFNLFNGIKKIK